MSRRDLALAVFVAVVWGFAFPVAKGAVVDIPPLLFASLRFAVIAALALVLPRTRLPWRWLLGYGFAWGTVQFGGLFLALSFGLPAGLTSIVLQSQLVFTLAFAVVLRLEAPAIRHLWTIGLATVGLVVIGTAQDHRAPLAGFVAGVCAAAGWAAANVLTRRLAQQQIRVDTAGFLARVSIIPAISLFALSLVVDGRDGVVALATHLDVRTAAALAYQSVLAVGAAGLTWNRLLRRYSPSTIAPFSLLVPVVALVAGRVVFGETISARQALGTAMLLAGLVDNLLVPPR
jgi:O-acetylserine/cysteine efflux transporter